MIFAGLLLVMVWIGGMKFTLVEAKGIEPLLKASPLMSWIPDLFGLQGSSNVIGTVELIGAAALLAWRRHYGIFLLGALVNIGTYATTQTFLFTLPAWHPELGMPALGGAGQFIVKDLVLLAGTLLLVRHAGPASEPAPWR